MLSLWAPASEGLACPETLAKTWPPLAASSGVRPARPTFADSLAHDMIIQYNA